jgi:NitT/TauT family transport system substrate-binding protein
METSPERPLGGVAARHVSRRTLLGSALGLSLAACGGRSPGGSPASGAASSGGSGGSGTVTKVTVGLIAIIDVAPLYLGLQQGFFRSHGLEITPHLAQGGAAIVPAVLTGQDQFGFSNVVSLLTAREKGVPLISIAAGASSTGDPKNDVNAVLVGERSTLRSARDLEGKKVAINSLNNIGDTTIKTSVKKAGGDPGRIRFVEMAFPEMPAQLTSGTVDAVWEGEPFRSQIIAAGGRILLDNLTETYPKLQIAHYFTSEQTKQRSPQVVGGFVAAINESMTYASAHPDEVRTVLGTYTKITPEVAAKVVLPSWPTRLDHESAQAVGEAAHSFGTLSKAPDVTGLLGG